MKTLAAISLRLCGALLFAGCANSPEISETVHSDAFYAASQREADALPNALRKDFGKEYAVYLGSSSRRDYVPISIDESIPPDYPSGPLFEGKQGIVTVRAIIDSSGKVIDAVVIDSTDTRFNQLALIAFRKWRFKPALYKGVPVMCRLQEDIWFKPK